MDSFDNLVSIQQSYINKLDEWKEKNVISDVISTYRGALALAGENITLVKCNLYICMKIEGIQEDITKEEIELSEPEIEQIPSVVMEFTNRISQDFNLPIDFEGEGLESRSPPHISIRHYWRTLQHPKYHEKGFTPMKLLKAATEGSKIGLQFYSRVKNSNTIEEVKMLVNEMWNEVKKVRGLSHKERMKSLHFAAHTIPKVFGMKVGNKLVGGFVDFLLAME